MRWKILFDLADRHGTQPLLYEALLTVENAVPPEEMSRLQQGHRNNLHRALFLALELIRIVDRLSDVEIEVLPYKGLALAELIYGDIALRQAGDIDLLIRPRDFPRARDAIRELGYTPHLQLSAETEQAYLRSGYECSFDGTAGRNLLELQWAMQPCFYAVDFDMDAVFQRAVTCILAGHRMRTPCVEDLFLVLAVHAAKHVWGRLIWLCDLARIMNWPSLNWDHIEAQSRMLGVARIVQITMQLASRLLDTVPPAVPASFSRDLGTIPMVEEIETHLISEVAFEVESLAYFRLMMRLRERPADRLRFLQRLVFTPGPSEWEAVRLPRPLFPLYRLVRLSRLAARLARA